MAGQSLWKLCDRTKSEGLLEEVRTAIAQGTDVNEPDNYQSHGSEKTPLLWALFWGHHDVALELLDHPEIDVNRYDSAGYNALHFAMFLDQHKCTDSAAQICRITEVLLARQDRASINFVTVCSETPLMAAIRCSAVNFIPLMLASPLLRL